MTDRSVKPGGKRLLRGLFKLLGMLAGAVFFFTPFQLAGGLVCMGAVFFGVCCLLAWSKLDEDPEITDLWPPRDYPK
jgi:hypothetical protein